MSHWCLREVDYEQLDFLEQPVLAFNTTRTVCNITRTVCNKDRMVCSTVRWVCNRGARIVCRNTRSLVQYVIWLVPSYGIK